MLQYGGGRILAGAYYSKLEKEKTKKNEKAKKKPDKLSSLAFFFKNKG